MDRLITRLAAHPAALGWRTFCAVAFWWVLTGGEPGSWLIGIPAVALAVIISFQLTPSSKHRLRLLELPGFLFYFLWTSLIAGIDIARRTLHPSLPLKSHYVTYHTQLQGLPRWLFMSSLSLMPGTLSVSSEADGLLIHSLDDAETTHHSLQQLEGQISRLLISEKRT
ncbi:MAG: Na+/H+ antiporter subunit E [Nitrincola lacisaponensis]|uniref:Na+/H+ antiporter subunit E n=1 Tax=Nitrincola lacisaponensis TaxID=267850 RepID=UPI00391AE193